LGKASRRKQHRANLGKVPTDRHRQTTGLPIDEVPPLQPGERGLVVSAPIEIQLVADVGFRGILVHRMAALRGVPGGELGQLHPQELRFALLFWERLAWPWSPVLALDNPDVPSPEVQLLHSEGVISRPKFLPRGSSPVESASFIVDTQQHALALLEKRDPGCWSMALGENSLAINDQEEAFGHCLGMSLHRAIAVPTAEAALDDVLEFRLRRRPELLALRSAIEEAAIKVSNDADRALSLHRELEKLDAACANQVRVAKENKFPLRVGSLHTLVATTGGAYAGVAEFATSVMQLPAASAQVVGGVAAATTFGVELHRTVKALALERKTPYDYVGKYHEELFR
jgi:Family of unknown function (DUF6236)